MKETQCDKILRHLKAGRTITPLEAVNRFGCLALSQRIGDLKREGVKIQSKRVKRGKKHVAQYRLAA